MVVVGHDCAAGDDNAVGDGGGFKATEVRDCNRIRDSEGSLGSEGGGGPDVSVPGGNGAGGVLVALRVDLACVITATMAR